MAVVRTPLSIDPGFSSSSGTGGTFIALTLQELAPAIQRVAIFFTAELQTISEVFLQLITTGGPGPIRVSIQPISGGNPTGSVVAGGHAWQTFATSDITSSPIWKTFANPATGLTIGTIYAIVIEPESGIHNNSTDFWTVRAGYSTSLIPANNTWPTSAKFSAGAWGAKTVSSANFCVYGYGDGTNVRGMPIRLFSTIVSTATGDNQRVALWLKMPVGSCDRWSIHNLRGMFNRSANTNTTLGLWNSAGTAIGTPSTVDFNIWTNVARATEFTVPGESELSPDTDYFLGFTHGPAVTLYTFDVLRPQDRQAFRQCQSVGTATWNGTTWITSDIRLALAAVEVSQMANVPDGVMTETSISARIRQDMLTNPSDKINNLGGKVVHQDGVFSGVNWGGVDSVANPVEVGGVPDVNVDTIAGSPALLNALNQLMVAVGSLGNAAWVDTDATVAATGNTTSHVAFSLAPPDFDDKYEGLMLYVENGTGVGQRTIIGEVTGTEFDVLAGTELITPLAADSKVRFLGKANNATSAQATDIQGRLPAVLISGRMDASVGALGASAITAASIAAGAFTAAKFATDANEAIATATWSASTRVLTAGTNITLGASAITNTSFAAGAITNSSIAPDAIGASEMAADAITEIVNAVWNELIAGHLGAGSMGAALNAAGAAGDPWTTPLPGSYGSGTAGWLVGNQLDVSVGTRASQTSLDVIDDLLDTEIGAIKAKTDQLTFTVANRVNVTVSGYSAGQDPATLLNTRFNSIDAALVTIDNFIDSEIGDIKAVTDQIQVPMTFASIADAVMDELLSGHVIPGSAGAGIAAAASAGDPWSTVLPGVYGIGTAGKIIGDNLNAAITSRATPAQVNAEVLDVLNVDVLIHGRTIVAATQIMAGMLAGLVSGAGSGDETFFGLDGLTEVAIVTADEEGNRAAVEYFP
jgi:hypothetical protein